MKTKITFPSARTVMLQAICVGADVLAKNAVAALLALF